jgi:hypothetical protein
MTGWIMKIFRTATWGRVILRYQRLEAAIRGPKPSGQGGDEGYEIVFTEHPGYPNLPAGSTTVEVHLPDGSLWGATLYTPEGVRQVLDEWRERDGTSGLYFWAPGVLIARDLDRSSVVALVDDLIAEGEFQKAFVRLG